MKGAIQRGEESLDIQGGKRGLRELEDFNRE